MWKSNFMLEKFRAVGVVINVTPDAQVKVEVVVPQLGVNVLYGKDPPKLICCARWPRPEKSATNIHIPFMSAPKWDGEIPQITKTCQNAIVLYYEEVFCVFVKCAPNHDEKNRILSHLDVEHTTSFGRLSGEDKVARLTIRVRTSNDQERAYNILSKLKRKRDHDGENIYVTKSQLKPTNFDKWVSNNRECDVVIICHENVEVNGAQLLPYQSLEIKTGGENITIEKFMNDYIPNRIMYDRVDFTKIMGLLHVLKKQYENVAVIDCMRNRPAKIPSYFWKYVGEWGMICGRNMENWLTMINKKLYKDVYQTLFTVVKELGDKQLYDSIYKKLPEVAYLHLTRNELSEKFKAHCIANVSEDEFFQIINGEIHENRPTVKFFPFDTTSPSDTV